MFTTTPSMHFRKLAAAGSLAILSACAPISSQAPSDDPNGPGFTVGSAQRGRYSAPIGMSFQTKQFSVAIPQARDAYEYLHMWRNDERSLNWSKAEFGPAALDGTIYRVTVGKKIDGFDSFIAKSLSESMALAKKTNGYSLHKLSEEAITVNGHPALFSVYEQIIPDSKNELLPSYNKGMFSHAFYFINYGDTAAMLWIQTTSSAGVNAVDKITQRQMIQRLWEPQQYFVNSFKIE